MLSLFNKYKSTYYETFKDLTKNSILYTLSLFLIWYTKDSYLSMITIPLFSLMTIRTFIIYHDCGTTLPSGNQDYCEKCEKRYNEDKPQLSRLINEESESSGGGFY